ncbi:hypothetical protein PGO03_22450 [Klebsiella aerogenes]|uniref:hypothetical protein n=1 Tax=Klebsiella aerogenes TaxID=548 RepID=UPI0007B3A13D|nr:hypothetical protein [Klebsiella aerogenes]EKW1040056.1 hypothetical protein [Klebsiella aerogenes]ELA2277429.1 hypothetical protein [Klebsiella aerogenes]KZQ00422.1 hypothetical protein A3N42_05575 [Klebsiella aerogenes]MCY4766535.1 hypothetical protein [Klebsiella aerogenes]HBQ1809299.1 hypothetical protein [Klebsiella aerogenes]
MTFPGQFSKALPDYGFARSLGLVSGAEIDFKALANQLDCYRNFSQVGIIYSDGSRQWLVRPSRRIATPNESSVSHVVVTKVTTSANNPAQLTTNAIQSSSLVTEIGSTAISCGAAILTIILSVGANMAIPLTAGTSSAVAAVIIAGGVATGIQCANGLGRLSLIAMNHDDYVAWLDSHEWYTATNTALDMISLAGAGAGLKSAMLTYRLLNRSTSESLLSLLKKMNRADRTRLTEEIIRIRNPGISNSGIKVAMKAGIYPKRYPSEALQMLLQRELMNAITNSSAFVGSAISGTIRNPQNMTQSGKYIFGLIQSFSFTGPH